MTVLLVEDEKSYALFMKHMLVSNGAKKTLVAKNSIEAIEHAKNHEIGIILMDIDIEGEHDGIETARIVRTYTDAPIIYLTASQNKQTISKAIRTHADGYLVKPCEQEDLFIAIESALHRQSEKRKQLVTDQVKEHSQKLETVGALAAGIAHDFNNILAIIHSHAEILRLKTKPQNPHYKYIESIFNASTKGASLVKGLMQFTRAEDPINRVFPPNQVVNETVDMLQRLVRKDITLKTDLSPNTSEISFIPSQLQQIIINLCLNARDSIKGRGSIQIKTDLVSISSQESTTLSEGNYVSIEIMDTGTGIPLHILDKIFEPFFTTKSQESGTGLGLAMSLQIARKAGGDLQLVQTGSNGTSFIIYLPTYKKTS